METKKTLIMIDWQHEINIHWITFMTIFLRLSQLVYIYRNKLPHC